MWDTRSHTDQIDLLDLFIGGTVVGIAVKGGVILAADRKAAYRNYVQGYMKKVFKITERVGIAGMGIMGDMGYFVKLLQRYATLYEMDTGKEIGAKALASLAGSILHSRRDFPLIIECVVGGYENDKPTVISLDLLGAQLADPFTACGTGAETALGTLEEWYREDMPLEEAEKLAIRAIRASSKRDIATGLGIDILIITKKGIQERFVPQEKLV
ncbi:MAG: proteasome subunit beta [Candidatus Baldrarchaeia archaeon]